MEIWHRITFGHIDRVDSIIDAANVKYKKSPLPGGGHLIHVDVCESDPQWPQMAALVRHHSALDMYDTVFTPEEISSAQWVRLIPIFEQGYPQPQGTWVTDPVNYADHCSQCGTFRQVASFRLMKEPNMAKNDFVSLFWTYALFCTFRVVDELTSRQLRGFEVREAIIHRQNTQSEKVAQIFIPSTANLGLIQAEDLERENCKLCHVTKYRSHMKGVMFIGRDAMPSGVDIINTFEWFGSGHNAYREIIVSNRFARLVLERGWRGVRMKVVELE